MLLFEDEKRDGTRLRIHLAEYNGVRFIDCRRWFLAEDGRFVATRQGVTLSLRRLREVISALERVERLAGPSGSLDHEA